MPDSSASLIPRADEVVFLPLGGTGEIGMNMNLYGHDGAWLMVDAGVTFGNDDFPEFDVLMADPAFIEARRGALAGIVLTHGHEDHIGALPYLWRRLGCPLYATPFTAAMIRAKLSRAGIDDAPLTVVHAGKPFRIGPFTVEVIQMTHSIPESNALLVSTPAGAVLHTGDWKLDDDPVVGERYDADRLRALRDTPLLAVVCDSTNAMVPGSTGSEGSLLAPLAELARGAPGRVVVTGFASNVARLVTLARVAAATGRRFGVVGPAMERMAGIARGTGYWPADLPALVDARHLGYLPRHEVLAACTGSQGEPRSALAKMAADSHRDLALDAGDTVIFSSRLIPGNEKPVERLEQRLRDRGLQVVTSDDAPVHVSGHPARDDLRRLYEWVQPPLAIPVHGTPRHLAANADVASSARVPAVQLMRNGELRRLGRAAPAAGEPATEVANGRLWLRPDGELEAVPSQLLAAMRARVS